MLFLLKLLLAHFLGDFLLQPKSWVRDKEQKKAGSWRLYLHFLLHGLLVLLLLWDLNYWKLALVIVFVHATIDLLKIFAQKPTTRTLWFFWDQLLHLLSIFVLWLLWFEPHWNVAEFFSQPLLWLVLLALVFVSVVTGILIEVLLGSWSRELPDGREESLISAGRYIGYLERLMVFVFIITEHWEAVGFLLAAKSVFRFGDLKEARSRKLTEYILIGTLLSFGIAIATGLLFLTAAQVG